MEFQLNEYFDIVYYFIYRQRDQLCLKWQRWFQWWPMTLRAVSWKESRWVPSGITNSAVLVLLVSHSSGFSLRFEIARTIIVDVEGTKKWGRSCHLGTQCQVGVGVWWGQPRWGYGRPPIFFLHFEALELHILDKFWTIWYSFLAYLRHLLLKKIKI